MILFNTTFCVDATDQHAFMEWTRTVYVPAALSNGHSEVKVLRIASAETNAATFAVQFVARTPQLAQQWQFEHLPKLTAEAAERFGLHADRLLHFSTAMEIIE